MANFFNTPLKFHGFPRKPPQLRKPLITTLKYLKIPNKPPFVKQLFPKVVMWVAFENGVVIWDFLWLFKGRRFIGNFQDTSRWLFEISKVEVFWENHKSLRGIEKISHIIFINNSLFLPSKWGQLWGVRLYERFEETLQMVVNLMSTCHNLLLPNSSPRKQLTWGACIYPLRPICFVQVPSWMRSLNEGEKRWLSFRITFKHTDKVTLRWLLQYLNSRLEITWWTIRVDDSHHSLWPPCPKKLEYKNPCKFDTFLQPIETSVHHFSRNFSIRHSNFQNGELFYMSTWVCQYRSVSRWIR